MNINIWAYKNSDGELQYSEAKESLDMESSGWILAGTVKWKEHSPLVESLILDLLTVNEINGQLQDRIVDMEQEAFASGLTVEGE